MSTYQLHRKSQLSLQFRKHNPELQVLAKVSSRFLGSNRPPPFPAVRAAADHRRDTQRDNGVRSWTQKSTSTTSDATLKIDRLAGKHSHDPATEGAVEGDAGNSPMVSGRFRSDYSHDHATERAVEEGDGNSCSISAESTTRNLDA